MAASTPSTGSAGSPGPPGPAGHALAAWEPLAAFAWRSYERRGRGLVLAHEQTIERLARTPDDPAARSALAFVELFKVPAADDFRPLMEAYDPEREVLVLVGIGDEGEEVLLRLAARSGDRPAPPACAAADGDAAGPPSAS